MLCYIDTRFIQSPFKLYLKRPPLANVFYGLIYRMNMQNKSHWFLSGYLVLTHIPDVCVEIQLVSERTPVSLTTSHHLLLLLLLLYTFPSAGYTVTSYELHKQQYRKTFSPLVFSFLCFYLLLPVSSFRHHLTCCIYTCLHCLHNRPRPPHRGGLENLTTIDPPCIQNEAWQFEIENQSVAFGPNCLCMKLDRYATNHRNKACDVSSTTTSVESTN